MPIHLTDSYVQVEFGPHNIVIYHYGATLTSWKFKNKEMLFISNKAILNGTKAIRGGIPIVFPQFGPGKLQQHGFARNTVWKWLGVLKETLKDLTISFSLESNMISTEFQNAWPFSTLSVI